MVSGTTLVALIREATKLCEECIRGVAEDLLERYADTSFRGDFVVGMRPTDNAK